MLRVYFSGLFAYENVLNPMKMGIRKAEMPNLFRRKNESLAPKRPIKFFIFWYG